MKSFLLFIVAVLSFTFTATPVFAASAELIRLLDSAGGRYILLETQKGAEIATRAIGRRLTSDAEISALITRLDEQEMQRVARKLEADLKRIENRFDGYMHNRRFGLSEALGEYEKNLVKRVADELLMIPVAMYPASVSARYTSTRAAYMRMLEIRPDGAPIVRYPQGVDPLVHSNWNMQFGFESEYAFEESDRLLSVYGPSPEFGISAGQWQNMTLTERKNWVFQNMSRLFPNYREAGGLVKLEQSPELQMLPERLIRDNTGNFEIVLKPVETFEEWSRNVKVINERFGAGSMQGTVSIPTDAFFVRNSGAATAATPAAIEENLGFFNFMNDLDTLEKLESGAAKYLSDPTKETVKSFSHPFLGPMTRMKQLKLIDYLSANAKDQMVDKDALRFISGSDASFKYIGGTAYRPDLVPSLRIIMEARDAHKSLELLADRMVRSTYYMQFGRAPFRQVSQIKAFDSVLDFMRLPRKVQVMLREVFPKRLQPGQTYSTEEETALEIFRNYAYPMRDWSNHLRIFKATKLTTAVTAAQQNYVRNLEIIADELAAGRLSQREAAARVQGELGKFANDSGIGKAMRRWQSRNLTADTNFNKYMNLAVGEMAPVASFFPQTIWEGALDVRLARLVQKWPQNFRIVEDVRFPFEGPGRPAGEASRKVLVISTDGLSVQQIEALSEDYINAMARGTLSFPLTERASHLHTRLGVKDMDVISDISINRYSPSHGRRLEPVIALSVEEELRLRFYVENILGNKDKVIGNFHMDGTTRGTPGRNLRNNLPVDLAQGHNCTSWLCTAPVGANGQSLIEMVGATPANEIHTNPGWWSYFLTGAAKAERIPFVVYWTKDPLAVTEGVIRSGQRFPAWDFYLH